MVAKNRKNIIADVDSIINETHVSLNQKEYGYYFINYKKYHYIPAKKRSFICENFIKS